MSDSIPRVTEIHAIPQQEFREGSQLDTARNVYTLLQVRTDAGITGIGSCYTSTDLVRAALGRLHDLIIGEVAIEPERVHEKLEQSGFWWGRGGTITHTISGIDIALWDIFGQVTGQPIARLLGGYYREKVKPYASLSMSRHDQLKADLEAAMARGFKAFKLGWGRFGRTGNPADDEAIIRMARQTVGDGEIMVDPGGSQQFWPHSYKWALRTADMLADYDVVWFEEALPPDDLEGYKLLREHSRVMISAGEVLTRRQSFEPFLEQGAWDIVQPDCTKVGGISEARHIAWMAYRHNILTVPHGWNTAVGLAADMHLIAALPVGKWVEYHQPSQVIDEIVVEPFQMDEEGMLRVPTKPGLGIELDWDGIEKLSYGTYKHD
ncbi:MAG: mandelate racemase/muconate lactonizing enzyme family protein [Chloroflexi bacterium]|nr:mandelate racemase/muconate lactonizing enzyme family protein [Chloroflexota bacterium]